MLTNNNLLLKIYCKNIVVTFLKIFLFFILFVLSQPCNSSIRFSSFFFSFFFLLHTLSLSLSPFFYLRCLPRSSLERSKLHSPALSLYFFFFKKKLDSIGHLCKNAISPLFSPQFSSRFRRMRFVGSGVKIFSLVFHPQCFHSFAK